MEQREEYKGFWFSVNTPHAVRNAITHAHAHGLRVRIHQGDIKTGRVWLEECDVMGRIGRSTGPQKVPLLIHSSRSYGGRALLDHCILGVQVTDGGSWLYKAPNFQLPEFEIEQSPTHYLPFGVLSGGETQARFKTEKAAKNYIAFMRGERMRVN